MSEQGLGGGSRGEAGTGHDLGSQVKDKKKSKN